MEVMTEAVEICPYCECENIFANWDTDTQGYIATCWNCGKKILLCDECLHADDNTGKMCDWHRSKTEEGCFRGITWAKKPKAGEGAHA